MAITLGDVRIFASLRMTDNSDGGGAMSPNVVVSGVDNNVFPDVTDVDTLIGAVRLRKLFGAVISDNTDLYQSAHLIVTDLPDVAGVSTFTFAAGAYATDKAAMTVELQKLRWAGYGVAAGLGSDFPAQSPPARFYIDFDANATLVDLQVPSVTLLQGTSPPPALSEFLAADTGSVPYPEIFLAIRYGGAIHFRSPLSHVNYNLPVTVDAPMPGSGTNLQGLCSVIYRNPTDPGPRLYGASETQGSTLAGATSLFVARTLVKLVPNDNAAAYPTAEPASWQGVRAPFVGTYGYGVIFENNDAVLVHHTDIAAPAAVSNGQTADTGRVNLSRLRVLDANDVEVARFDKGLAAPIGVGCTADLAAGTVTFTSVAGMQMPVRVESRIEELNRVFDIRRGLGELKLARPMSRAYPSGTLVSSLNVAGDLQARQSLGFAQTAWVIDAGTGSLWKDSIIGGQPAADYNQALYPILVTNRGAVTQRWALIFTAPSAFRLVGEDIGEVAQGTTGSDFAPLNPATGAPYFTIRSAGWGTWSAGNVYRFNTHGANAPIWQGQTIAVGATAADDAAAIEFRGYINS